MSHFRYNWGSRTPVQNLSDYDAGILAYMFMDFARRKVLTHRVFARAMQELHWKISDDDWVEMVKAVFEKAEDLPNPEDVSYIGFNTFSVMSWLKDCIEDVYPWDGYSSYED